MFTGSWQTRVIGRLYVEDAVLTSTTRTCPSFPGNVFVTLPSSHLLGGGEGWSNKTTAPSVRFSCTFCHLYRDCSSCKYSRDHTRHNNSWNFCTCCHRDKCDFGSSLTGGTGREFNGLPVKKCPGVRISRHSGSSRTRVIGREFKVASTLHNNVCISSEVGVNDPMIRRR